MKTLKKWPLLFQHQGERKVRLVDAGISTFCVWHNCAGSDSEDHIKEFRKAWPEASAKAIKMAIAFERTKRGMPL